MIFHLNSKTYGTSSLIIWYSFFFLVQVWVCDTVEVDGAAFIDDRIAFEPCFFLKKESPERFSIFGAHNKHRQRDRVTPSRQQLLSTGSNQSSININLSITNHRVISQYNSTKLMDSIYSIQTL